MGLIFNHTNNKLFEYFAHRILILIYVYVCFDCIMKKNILVTIFFVIFYFRNTLFVQRSTFQKEKMAMMSLRNAQ